MLRKKRKKSGLKGGRAVKVIVILSLLVSLVSFSQSDSTLELASISPEFIGGEAEMAAFISENFVYPEISREMGEQGTVYVRFVVHKSGVVRDAEVVKGVSPAIDNEAVRVIMAMPDWIPGEQDGEPVSVWYTIPIRARLDSNFEPSQEKIVFEDRIEFNLNYLIIFFGMGFLTFVSVRLVPPLLKAKERLVMLSNSIAFCLAFFIILVRTKGLTLTLTLTEIILYCLMIVILSLVAYFISPIEEEPLDI